MIFWGGWGIGITIISFLVIFLKDRYSKRISFSLLILLIFISAFRYNLATDYSSYVELFTTSNLNSFYEIFYPEPTFVIISESLKELGFSYQMMFVIYAVIFFAFFWKGLKFFLDNNYKKIALALCIFSVSSYCGYWESMNTVRQMAAASIIFFGMKYLYLGDRIKYTGFSIVAGMFHYSALPMLFFQFLPKRFTKTIHEKKIYWSLIFISLGLYFLDIGTFIYPILDFLNRGGKYQYISNITDIFGLKLMFVFGIYLFTSILSNIKEEKKNFCYLMYTMSICFIITISSTHALERIAFYFYLFLYPTLADALCSISINRVAHKLCAVGIIFLLNIPLLSFLDSNNTRSDFVYSKFKSASNIEYKMNFNLWEE